MKDGKMRTGGGAKSSKKLLAAAAILAVTFIILAAVPAVATDSYASEPTEISTVSGLSTALSGSGGNYKMTENLVINKEAVMTVANAVTLDLNGHKISKKQTSDFDSTGTDASVSGGDPSMRIANVQGGSLTITDSSTGKTGKIIGQTSDGNCPSNGNAHGKSPLAVGSWGTTTTGTIILEEVTIESDLYCVNTFGYGKLQVNDSTLSSVWRCGVASSGNDETASYGEIKVTGGSITSQQSATVYAAGSMPMTFKNVNMQGVTGIEVRGGNISLENVNITIIAARDNTVGSDGPTGFAIPVAVFASSTDSYWNPDVTLKDVSVSVSSGVTLDAALYYGTFSFTSGQTFSQVYEASKSVTTAKHYATLSVYKGGNKVFAIEPNQTENKNNLSLFVVDLNGKTIGNAVLDKVNMTVGSGSILTVASGSTMTVNPGSTLKDNGSIVIENGAELKFAKDAGNASFSYLEAGQNATITMRSGTLNLESLGWRYSTATVPASVRMSSSGEASIRFDSPFVQGAVADVTLFGTGSATITGAYPVSAGTTLKVQVPVSGSILLFGQGNTAAKMEISGSGSYTGTVSGASISAEYDVTLGKSLTAQAVGGSGSSALMIAPTSDGFTLSGSMSGGISTSDSMIGIPNGSTLSTSTGSTISTSGTGSISIADGGKLSLSGSLNATVQNDGTIEVLSGGTLSQVSGKVRFVGATISDDMIVPSGSTLVLGGDVTVAEGKALTFSESSDLEVDTANSTLTLQDGAELDMTAIKAFSLTAKDGSVGIKFLQTFEDSEFGNVDITGEGAELTVGGIFAVPLGKILTLKTALNGNIGLTKQNDTTSSMVISDGGIYTGTASNGTNSISLAGIKAGSNGTVTVYAGSVKISGLMSASEVETAISSSSGDVVLKDLTITGGEVKLSTKVSIEGALKVSGSTTLTVDSSAEVTMGSGAELSVDSGATVAVSDSASLAAGSGSKITVDDGAKITVDEGSTVTVGSGATMSISKNSSVSSTGTGKLVVEQSAKVDVSGTLDANTQNSGQINASTGSTVSEDKVDNTSTGKVTKQTSFIVIPDTTTDSDPVVIVPQTTESTDSGTDVKTVACIAAALVVVVLAVFILADTRHR